MALALAGERLREHGLHDRVRLVPVEPRRAFDVGGLRVEPIRVTHSVVDGARLRDRDAGRHPRAHGRLQVRPAPDRRRALRLPPAGGAGGTGRAVPHVRLDERRPARDHALRARGRARAGRAVSSRPRARHPRDLRLARPPHPAGPGPRRHPRPQGRAPRPEHGDQRAAGRGARVSPPPRGDARPARGAVGAAALPSGDPLHREPGRAELGAWPSWRPGSTDPSRSATATS